MKQFIRVQNTEGNEVIINTDYIIKITAQPKTHNNYERTMIELSVDTGVNIFTYLSTDAIYNKLN
jgi:hypothetical protein